MGRDYKDDICNSMLKFYPTYMQDEKRFAKALFIKKYPSSLSDRFLTELATVPAHTIISIDIAPIPKDVTTSTLQKKYMGIESDIIRQQRVRNKNNDFSSDISYNKRTEKQQIEETMDDVRENDQRLFYVAVTIIIKADTKEELEATEETLVTIGKRNSCQIEAHYLKQREALNTALPIGVRQVETMRTLMTQSLAVLMPFNVQELYLPGKGGAYYGVNQVSRNILFGNRKRLVNGIENISDLCRCHDSQNPEHIYDITKAVIQSAQYMVAVRIRAEIGIGTEREQGNGSYKRTEKAGYEQLSLSFDGGYAFCDCGRAL